METIKIHVEVALSDATLGVLRDLAGRTAPAQEKPAAAAPEPKAAPAAVAAPEEDIPNQVLFDLVRGTMHDRGVSPDAIRAVFREFGIASSSECPQERRRELVERLKAL